MRRRILYSKTAKPNVPITEANYADICYYDSDTDEFIIVSASDIEEYTDSNYTPIGIVAVPSSHTDEGRPRIMSLVYMNCDTPQSGSTEPKKMYWGDEAIYCMSNDNFPYIGNYNTDITNSANVLTTTGNSVLPSDSNGQNGLNKFIYENPSNSNEHFYTSGSHYSDFLMCSPYKQDGSKDERYFKNTTVLSYFDGNILTKDIIAERGNRDYSSWTPSYDEISDYPAASCCDMFHTIGTNQGDWYLPSAGELGYVIARMQAIQNSLQTLKTKEYPIGLINMENFNFTYWSSMQYNYIYGIYANFSNGIILRTLKQHSHCVRAFIQL